MSLRITVSDCLENEPRASLWLIDLSLNEAAYHDVIMIFLNDHELRAG